MGKVAKYGTGDIIRLHYREDLYTVILSVERDGVHVYLLVPSDLKRGEDSDKYKKEVAEHDIRMLVWKRGNSFARCVCGSDTVGHPGHAKYCPKAGYNG